MALSLVGIALMCGNVRLYFDKANKEFRAQISGFDGSVCSLTELCFFDDAVHPPKASFRYSDIFVERLSLIFCNETYL